MEVARASIEDAVPVMELIRRCVVHMRAAGTDSVTQWDDIYPSLEVVEEDARAGSLFVMRQEGLPIASVCLNEVQPPEYAPLPWRHTDGPVLVVHRLCVDPAYQGRGIARLLMDFAERFAPDNGYASIRLDTYTGNPRALALYERRGYRRTGQVFFPRRRLPFHCFEKAAGNREAAIFSE